VVYVIVRRFMRTSGEQRLPALTALGLLAGLAIMYVTGLFVAA
jgi:hypothetical protein